MPPIERPAVASPRTVAAPRRRKKATARSTRPKTSSPMATPGCDGDETYVKRLGPVPGPPPRGSLSNGGFLLSARAPFPDPPPPPNPLSRTGPPGYHPQPPPPRGGAFLPAEPHL